MDTPQSRSQVEELIGECLREVSHEVSCSVAEIDVGSDTPVREQGLSEDDVRRLLMQIESKCGFGMGALFDGKVRRARSFTAIVEETCILLGVRN